MTLLEQLRQRRDTARQSAEQILTRAADEQRDLTPDELAEHRQQVTAEREASDEADRVRDEQIAELRATAARRTAPAAPRGPVLTASRASRTGPAPAASFRTTSRCLSTATSRAWPPATGKAPNMSGPCPRAPRPPAGTWYRPRCRRG